MGMMFILSRKDRTMEKLKKPITRDELIILLMNDDWKDIPFVTIAEITRLPIEKIKKLADQVPF